MARNSEPLYLKLSDALAEQIMDFVKIELKIGRQKFQKYDKKSC